MDKLRHFLELEMAVFEKYMVWKPRSIRHKIVNQLNSTEVEFAQNLDQCGLVRDAVNKIPDLLIVSDIPSNQTNQAQEEDEACGKRGRCG